MASISTIFDLIKFIRYNFSVSRTCNVCWYEGELYFIQNLWVYEGCVSVPHSTCLAPINRYLSSEFRKINLFKCRVVGLVNVLLSKCHDTYLQIKYY